MLYYIINGKLTKDIVNNTFEPFMKYNKIDTTLLYDVLIYFIKNQLGTLEN